MVLLRFFNSSYVDLLNVVIPEYGFNVIGRIFLIELSGMVFAPIIAELLYLFKDLALS